MSDGAVCKQNSGARYEGGFRPFPGALLLLIAAWLGIYPARSEQTKPTDEEVERAIRVCSVGTKTDAAVEGGLNVLKRRILTGEGEFSYSEIPSVIGRGVQTDAAKINLFERIQKCVVERVYGTAPPEGTKAVPATPPMRNPKTQPENPRAEEVLLWQSALVHNNRHEYELYLQKFPTGRFADIAKYRVDHIDNAGFELGLDGKRICERTHFVGQYSTIIGTRCKLSDGTWIEPAADVPELPFGKPRQLTSDDLRVLRYIFQTNGIHLSDAARALGYSEQMLRYYLDELLAVGYIDTSGSTDSLFLHPTPVGRAYIVEHGLANR